MPAGLRELRIVQLGPALAILATMVFAVSSDKLQLTSLGDSTVRTRPVGTQPKNGIATVFEGMKMTTPMKVVLSRIVR